MERNTFNALLKDLIAQLYDSITLETHPLTAAIQPPAGFHGRRGEYLHQQIVAAIEQLRPPSRTPSPNAPEWRPYLILHQRYVEGIAPPVLAAQLSLSERQLRRDHSRAMAALSNRLWEQLFTPAEALAAQPELQIEPGLQDFAFAAEPLDISQVVAGIVQMMENRAASEDVRLNLVSSAPPDSRVQADRIVLRQILISLFTYAFHLQASRLIEVRLSAPSAYALVEIEFEVDENWAAWAADERADLLETARAWGKRLNIALNEQHPPSGQAGSILLALSIPVTSQVTVLVIDDQQPALRMYQRYLSRTPLKVVGVDDPAQALDMARRLRPALILLDVMMPHIDGWEILQSLRAGAQTGGIPVIVCSAWEASDLARSLGAADFLKKPVTQRDLLDALQRLGW